MERETKFVNEKPKPLLNVEDLEDDFSKRKEPTTKERLIAAKLDPYEDIVEETPVLLINDVGFGTKGNISLFTGKAKSKKSMLLSMFTAVFLGHTGIKGFHSGLGTSNVIYFDTEQSKRHAQLQYRRISKLLGDEISNSFSYYTLRSYSPVERLKMIKHAIYSTPDLSVIIIDGIADLLSKGVNDEAEAIHITNLLMKWSLERNIHIITVLHQNKGDSNAKGHIGSQLVQKSETVLSIEKDSTNKEISKVTSQFSRGVELEEFCFSVDENGIPFLIEDYNTETPRSKSKSPFDYEKGVHYSILSDVFNNRIELKYKDLQEKIKYVLGTYSISIGDSKSRDWITYYKEQELVIQDGQMKPYKLGKSVR